MVTVDRIRAYNFEEALRGMRHPLESYDKSDTCESIVYKITKGMLDNLSTCEGASLVIPLSSDNIDTTVHIGANDLDLARRLIKAGPEHAKFLRQIFVSMEITGPLYWFKELDTYKIGTTANSTSTMHKITSKAFTHDMFSYQFGFSEKADRSFIETLKTLEQLRQEYNLFDRTDTSEAKKAIWESIIRLLPESFNQTRTWTGNYAILRNQNQQRKGHKLIEWRQFLDAVKSAPYAKELIFSTL